jgi:hypothetical protein
VFYLFENLDELELRNNRMSEDHKYRRSFLLLVEYVLQPHTEYRGNSFGITVDPGVVGSTTTAVIGVLEQFFETVVAFPHDSSL